MQLLVAYLQPGLFYVSLAYNSSYSAVGLEDLGVGLASAAFEAVFDFIPLVVMVAIVAFFMGKFFPSGSPDVGDDEALEEVQELVEEHPVLASEGAMREFLKYKREKDWVEELKKSVKG